MLKCFQTDLHIHTCLSPCADLTMSPKRIIERAMVLKLDIIGICDHNSAENVQAAKTVGSDKEITVLPGIEITTTEEVHIIALFDEVEATLALQNTIYNNLTPGENKEELFGEQIIVNQFDEVEGYNNKLLIGATTLALDVVVNEIYRLGGLAIASHIDREGYSIIGQLGFIPEDLTIDALEISPNINRTEATKKFPQINNFPIISASDAHFLEDIGKATTSFMLAKPTIVEIRKALMNKENRKVVIEA